MKNKSDFVIDNSFPSLVRKRTMCRKCGHPLDYFVFDDENGYHKINIECPICHTTNDIKSMPIRKDTTAEDIIHFIINNSKYSCLDETVIEISRISKKC